MHIVNDLSKGKKQLVQLMKQLIENTQENQSCGANNGARGYNGKNGNQNHGGNNGRNGNYAEGSNNNIPAQDVTRTTNGIIPRPLMCHFLGDQQIRNQGKQGHGETFDDYLREYRDLSDEF